MKGNKREMIGEAPGRSLKKEGEHWSDERREDKGIKERGGVKIKQKEHRTRGVK